jgi:hypothetical protein
MIKMIAQTSVHLSYFYNSEEHNFLPEEKISVNTSLTDPLNAELNPICHFLALLGAHPILHIRLTTCVGFKNERHIRPMWAGMAELVQRLATGRTVWGANSGGGGRKFLHPPVWPWGPPSLLFSKYRVFPGL